MRGSCEAPTMVDLEAGHWLPLERKNDLVRIIRSWLATGGK
jgi:hypothetical protein